MFKRKPAEHQVKALDLSKDESNFALLMEQGTGKTKVIIDNSNYLYEKGLIDTLIVVAWPNGVHRNWVDNEIPQDCNVPYKSEFWSSNLTKEKQEKIKEVYSYKDGLRIMTYNIEGMTTEKAQKNIVHFIKTGKCMLVIDQSACIKNPQAKRTRFLLKLSKHPNVLYKRILDGDPSAEGAEELFTQFKFLDPEIIGLTSYTAFKAAYCKIGYFRNIIGYKNIDELYEKIKPHSFRCLADDCLDLPERIYKRWSFDLNKEERNIYDSMKKLNVAAFNYDDEPQIMEERLALVKNMRLQQISSGWFSSDKGKRLVNGTWKRHFEVLPIADVPSRMQAFQELIKIAKGKMLIFARFTQDIKLLKTVLGVEAVTYYGEDSDDDKAEAKKRFMEDPDVKYFIGQPNSAGIGHTLTEAKHIVFYSNSHSLRLRKECEKRAHRTGLKHKLIIWDLIAENTQDRNIVKCLIEKKKISDEIMKDPDNFFMKETV